MPDRPSYPSPAAFRRALSDRLHAVARTSRWSLPELQRQFAYDRLLQRLYLLDHDWIVKGATALLARDLALRGTVDLDMYRNANRQQAESELRAAAARRIGDWFRFETGAARSVGGGSRGTRIPIAAYVGTAPWAQFHVDLVGDELAMTGIPDDVPALARVTMPDVHQHNYRAYPLVDHVADKVAATFARYGGASAPSTRFKDLIDLVAIATQASVAAKPQMAALHSEAERRQIVLPHRFAVPHRELWQRGYAAETERSLLPIARSLEQALAVVTPFLDPLLDGSAQGEWDPAAGRWNR